MPSKRDKPTLHDEQRKVEAEIEAAFGPDVAERWRAWMHERVSTTVEMSGGRRRLIRRDR